MKHFQKLLFTAVLATALLPRLASAALILDTGTPTASLPSLSLDGTDYVAAEFSLGTGQTITSIEAFINGGNSGFQGDTFTVALYSASGTNVPGRFDSPVFAQQATYSSDGWNGLSNLNLAGLVAGNYWAAFEVGAADSTAGLLLPTVAANGTAAALGYAFSDGNQYQALTGENFGAQVTATAPVPLPGALLLLASGLFGVGGLSRFRRRGENPAAE
jgi:hypothetical protein